MTEMMDYEYSAVPENQRYLTFVTDGLIMGISTEYVIEIIANYSIRPLPVVPDYVRGIINLRGQVIPVIDLRLRMGREFAEYDSTTCIIIIEVDSTFVGLAVDSVLQVQEINAAKASPIPVENQSDLADAMIRIGDGSVVLLLNTVAILSA